jgi:hypothetical protein
MQKLELIQKVFAIGASILGVLSALAFFLVPGADENRLRYFTIFLVRNGIFDLVVLAAAFGFGWALLHLVRGVLAGEFSDGLPWTARQHRPAVVWLGVLAIAIVLLAVPARHLLRARWLYWSQLSREAYAHHDRTRVARLARTGRIGQAYTQANRTYAVLKTESEQDDFSGILQSLAARVSRAQSAKGENSPAAARSWNPIAQPERYFELAEAVRLNPEERAAADALGLMYSNLIRDALPADARAVCSPSAVAPPRRTVSQLEAEIRIQRLKASGDNASGVSACVRSLRVRWALDRVGCILAISHRTRQPFTTDEEDAWSPAALQECRGVALEGVYI